MPDHHATDRSTPVSPLPQPQTNPKGAESGASEIKVEVDISDPDVWERVAEQIGDHDYTYDLGDSSHRMDVVQIVLTALREVLSR